MVLTLGLGANAQSDGFFSTTYSEYSEKRESYGEMSAVAPALPRFDWVTDDGKIADQSAVPAGSGLLLLAGMGAAYAARKRRTSNEMQLQNLYKHPSIQQLRHNRRENL